MPQRQFLHSVTLVGGAISSVDFEPLVAADLPEDIPVAGTLTVSSPASGQPALITTSGVDADVPLKIRPQGSGFLQLGPDTHGAAFYSQYNVGLEGYRVAATRKNVIEIYVDTSAADILNANATGLFGRAGTQGATATQNVTSTIGVSGVAASSLPAGLTNAFAQGGNFQVLGQGGGTIAAAYGVFQQVQVISGCNITIAVGNGVWFYNTTSVAGVGDAYAYYVKRPAGRPTVQSATFIGLWMDDYSSGAATNAYFAWCDSPGVFRIKADGVLAYYNPAFAPKYTPGATAFERAVIQWANNCAQVGTEAGTTGGVLRPFRFIGSSVCFGTDTPNPAAALQLDSTVQGFLPPRVTTTQKNAIPSPPEGLVVYDTDLHAPCFYNGSAWKTVTAS